MGIDIDNIEYDKLKIASSIAYTAEIENAEDWMTGELRKSLVTHIYARLVGTFDVTVHPPTLKEFLFRKRRTIRLQAREILLDVPDPRKDTVIMYESREVIE